MILVICTSIQMGLCKASGLGLAVAVHAKKSEPTLPCSFCMGRQLEKGALQLGNQFAFWARRTWKGEKAYISVPLNPRLGTCTWCIVFRAKQVRRFPASRTRLHAPDLLSISLPFKYGKIRMLALLSYSGADVREEKGSLEESATNCRADEVARALTAIGKVQHQVICNVAELLECCDYLAVAPAGTKEEANSVEGGVPVIALHSSYQQLSYELDLLYL